VSDPAEGGAFLDAGVHVFDLLRWFTGSEVTHVFGSAQTYSQTSLAYLSGMAQLTFASGAIASIWISFELPPPGFRKHTLRTRVVGSRGVLDIDSYGQLLLGDADGMRVVLERAPYDMNDLTHPARLEQFIAQMLDYVDAVRAGREPPVGGADGRAAVQIVEAGYQSSATGEPVRLR
jgi:myo-inositol 2-dehydrogenase/D-chiro-inositol 1-dehydrogenase